MLTARKNRALNRLIYQALVYGPTRRHFARVRLRQAAPSPARNGPPVIVFANHCSWWDGYMVMLLNERVWGLDAYVMIEEAQLARYSFFRLLGGFSVDRQNPRSAAASLAYSAAMLNEKPGRMLLIFPQGEILANDRRPLVFYSGIGHIARRVPDARFYPLALRYEFVGEQKPEAFLSVGAPLCFAGSAAGPKEITAMLARALTDELDALRDDVTAYRFQSFTTLVSGAPGVNRVWDALRGKPPMREVGANDAGANDAGGTPARLA